MDDIGDTDLDNLLDDDPESQYHPPEDIKSVEALKVEIQMCKLFMKKGKIDAEEGKIKVDTLNSMLELATGAKSSTLEQYLDSVKDAWSQHQEWLQECQDDDSLGADQNSHVMRIKKRIEKIEAELTSMKVDVSKLKQPESEDMELLDELNSDENVDELSGEISDDNSAVEKVNAKPVSRMPTMEEKKQQISQRSSMVMNNYADEDVDDLLDRRLSEYINAIEYLKKNNLSKDQKAILAILERAELVKKLQKKRKRDDDVEVYEIPAEVLPDDILGISSKDRIKKFQAITNHVSKTMNELKMIGGNNFKIYNASKNPTAKDNYDRSIMLFKKQDQLKKDLLQLAKNRWQPLPEIQTVTENFTDVKKAGEVNASVTNVNIKIVIPEKFQNIGKYYYKFKWMDENAALKKLKVPNKGVEQERSFEIDFGHHKKLADVKIVIKVKLWRYGLFDKTVNTFETNLAMFKKTNSIKKNFKFQDHKFYVSSWLDMPMDDEENKNLEEVKLIEVAYTAPPFKSATGGAVQTKTTKATKAKPSSAVSKAKPSSAVSKASTSTVATAKKDVEVPEGVGPDEIKDPDVQRNLWSVYYCQQQAEKYEKKVNSYLQKKEPIEKAVKEKMMLFKSQVAMMTSAIENEQVSQEKYMDYLEKGLAHDRILLKYFEDTGNSAKANIVRYRIECYEKEISGDLEGEDEEESD